MCGFPGSGKSTAARYLAARAGASVLDKDSLAPRLEQSVMLRLTGDPFDRDSDTYRSVVAPGIYDSLIRTALTIAVRHPIVLDAPFLSPIRQAAAAGILLREHLHTFHEGPLSPSVTTIWLDSSITDIRARMLSRGAGRDASKLANWEAYRSDVLDSGVREIAHSVVDFVISN